MVSGDSGISLQRKSTCVLTQVTPLPPNEIFDFPQLSRLVSVFVFFLEGTPQVFKAGPLFYPGITPGGFGGGHYEMLKFKLGLLCARPAPSPLSLHSNYNTHFLFYFYELGAIPSGFWGYS